MTFLFYIFAALALVGGVGVVINRNPVSAALAMVLSFLGLAALLIQLDAFLAGVLQVLVYAGAIMVLFLFIIMLLDIPREERRRPPLFVLAGGGAVALGFAVTVLAVMARSGAGKVRLPALDAVEGTAGSDIHRIGELLFNDYWLSVQMIAVLLLAATVGVVVLSRKELR